MTAGPVYSMKVQMTHHEDGGATDGLPKEGGEHILTYVEVVSFLLKAYSTDSNTARI